ncbi:hypothetical protein GUITHDRAFT_162751 [Guillardia theta CCMP2712]|uniref:WASH1 WAHD domain-containing protein n=1 Tax=Guillardia theta (strain CCMP2712) TaxID=905079 RepID=L1JFX4_GUITC|nr:hypothetical protein GUITHDRAFT_162751 [Guillardia theta CCMP2712]EKX47044.1 hypothetical protein GUITHDRAFT_162751 [Guillardia theta CCMP2712]|eukprot:XP_005834024.1 hypothetical protein GUITHDRAFT_162751 [Guillardia theta CCMP2712]
MNSVNAMLLFNSSENPYRGYMILDNLAGPEDEDDREPSAKPSKRPLAEAPASVKHGIELPSFGTVDFGFNPELGMVPNMNLPNVLPGLPNLADEICEWQTDSIAPSAIRAALPQLPTVVIIALLPFPPDLLLQEKKKPPSKAGGQVDLMADLKARLDRRRTGIGGGKEKEKKSKPKAEDSAPVSIGNIRGLESAAAKNKAASSDNDEWSD